MSLRVSVVVDGRADGAEAALGKTAAGFDAVARKAREAGAATDDGAKKATPALNRMGVSTSNVAAQFQDIAVQLAAGQSPFLIALQQGTQLSSALGEGRGLKGTLAEVGKGFMSLLSPVSLATIGAIAFGGVALQALGAIIPKTESATDVLKRHVSELKEVVTGYRDAGTLVSEFSNRVQQLPRAAASIALDQQTKQIAKDLQTFLTEASQTAQRIASSRFANTADRAVAGLVLALDHGKISAADFAAQLQRLTVDPNMTAATKAWVADLQKGAAAAASIQDNIWGSFAQAALSKGPQDLSFGVDQAAAQRRDAQANQIELDAIRAKSPAQLADIARRREALSLADESISASLRQQKIDQAGTLAAAQAQHALSEAAAERLRSARAVIGTAETELQTIGRSIGETTRLTFVRQQLAQAEAEAAQNGTTVSAAYVAEIQRIGKAYGDLQQKIAEGKAIGDLLFARSQLGRSATEQDVASQLRQIYGDDTNSSQAQFLASQIRINAQLKELDDLGQSITRGFMSDLLSDLRQGQTLWQSIGNAGIHALNSIADKAAQMAADGIWNMIFNAVSAGVTGGSNSSSWTSAVAGIFGGKREGGGPVQSGRAYLVGEKRPEIFVPGSSGTILPNTGMGGGTMIFSPTVTIDATGSNVTEGQIRAIVNDGLTALSKTLPDRFEAYLRNPTYRPAV